MVKLPWSKKPWEKYLCVFVVQEFGASGEKGWADVSEPTSQIPTMDESHDLFKPGCSYQCMSKYVEGPKAGQFAGVVWRHFETLPGGLKPKERLPKVKKEKETELKPMKFSEIIKGYVGEVDEVLGPMVQLSEVFGKIRESFGVGAGGQASSPYTIPPPTFEGTIPILLHPYVVQTIGQEIRAVMDYGFKRIEKITGVPAGEEGIEEEEDFVLPKPAQYRKGIEAVKEEAEEVPYEEKAEIRPGVPVAIHKPPKKPKKKEVVEEVEEEEEENEEEEWEGQE